MKAITYGLFLACIFITCRLWSQNAQQPAVQASHASPPKELMKDSDPYSVAWYDTDEKILNLEARIKEIRRNLEANRENPRYDQATMKDILTKLEAVYEELRKSGKYPYLDKKK
jgi:hypothetical protein